MTLHQPSQSSSFAPVAKRNVVTAIGSNSLLLCLLAAAMLISLSIGRYHVSVMQIVHFLLAAAGLETMDTEQFKVMNSVIVEIRLPRILNAILVGGALSASGTSYQAVFRNPLVSPGILGVMSGASFGAAIGLLLDQNWIVIQTLAFCMGLLAVGVGVAIANIFGKASMVMLVLGGVISSGLFGSMLTLIKFLADPTDQLASIVYWLMGDLASANLHHIAYASIPLLIGVGVLTALGKGLDVLSMGDEEAHTLGVPVHLVRYSIVAAATLISALTVSLAGMIGWIGLIIPHIARLIFGPCNARLMPAATLLGAIFLVSVDAVSRSLTKTEVPIGVIMELLGIPIFLVVLHRARGGWN